MNPLASGSQSILFQKLKAFFHSLFLKIIKSFMRKIFYAMVPGVNFNNHSLFGLVSSRNGLLPWNFLGCRGCIFNRRGTALDP